MSEAEFRSLVDSPSKAEIQELASELGITIPDEQTLTVYTRAIQATTKGAKSILDWPESEVTEVTVRDRGHAPSSAENSHNQWAWKCEVTGNRGQGILAGKKVAIKDSVAMAGLPMDAGNAGLKGYIPRMDAPLVSRILGEGATIVGKTTCENLCFSALSHTSCHGVVKNPHDPTRSSGGSSSGSSVAVALGEVDMAIGSDTGGSIRMPGAFCGCVGLKPTLDLVPTVGLNACIQSCDHVGPICKDVYNCALLLEAIAGPEDKLHPVRVRDLEKEKYTEHLSKGVQGFRVAIVKEGFQNSDRDVSSVVLATIEKLRDTRGVIFEEISVPEHIDGVKVLALTANLEYAIGVRQNAQPYTGRTYLMPDMISSFKDTVNNQNEYGKISTIWSAFYNKNFSGLNLLPRAINRMAVIRSAYQEVFKKYDAVVMPTVPIKPPKNPSEPLDIHAKTESFMPVTPNTAPFDCSGHPSITVNCGYVQAESEGPYLPVGIQFSGRFYEEGVMLRLAKAVEDLAPPKPK